MTWMNEDYPYVLITGRHIALSDGWGAPRDTEVSREDCSEYLEMNRDDATALGLEDHAMVEVQSRLGSVTVPILRSGRLARGNLFMTFRDPTSATSKLLPDHRTAVQSHSGVFQYTPVRIVKP